MKSKKTDSRSRNWVFTLNNPKVEDHKWFINLGGSSSIRYYICGVEHAPTTGTEHLQGFISFKSAKTFKATKKFFGQDKIWLQEAKGNDSQNQEYCSKESKLVEIGEPMKQGKRSDIEKAVEIIKQTGSIRQVVQDIHNYQAVRHSELYMKYLENNSPRPNLQVINIWGASGAGKTRYVYKNHKDVFAPINFKWWEGYDAHKIVLIDDYRMDFCKFHELLRLIDKHPYRVECKGGSRQLRAVKIYITTPTPVIDMWRKQDRTDEDMFQLSRRITHTINIEEIDKNNTIDNYYNGSSQKV